MGLVRSRPGPHNQSMHRATKPWIAWPGVLCLGLLIGQPVWACLWIDGTSLEGSKRRISGVSIAQRLRASLESTPRLKDPGDSPESQAVGDLLEGRIDQAVEQLEALAKAQPDTYSLAANLGTAYELKGELALAHTWITRAMELNPQSHQGTEWLHLAILKARMALKTHPNHLRNQRIIPIEGPAPTFTFEGQSYDTQQLAKALEIQLSERMRLVKPKDAIVADLLFSLGLISAREQTLEIALELFDMAQQYGFLQADQLAAQKAQYQSLIQERHVQRALLIALALITLAAMLTLAFRKGWLTLRRSPKERLS